MSSPRKIWLNLLLWLSLLGSLGLEVYLLDRTQVAHGYYWNKVAVRDHKSDLYKDTPLVSSVDLIGKSTYLGKTVQMRGDLYTPEPLISKYTQMPCACYSATVKRRSVITRWEMRQTGTGKYRSSQRVRVEEEKWETLSSEYKVAPLFFKDALGQVPIVLKDTEPYVYFHTEGNRKREGDHAYEDEICPVQKAMVLIGQVDQQNGRTVLTHLPNQTFRVDWVVPGEAAALEQDLQRDWGHFIQCAVWGVGNGLFSLGLGIALWRRRKRRPQTA